MKLHLPSLLRHALLLCMACTAPAFADTYLAEGVDLNDLEGSTRFYDGGKGRDWDEFERAAYNIYTDNGNDLSIFGSLAASISAPAYQSRLDCSKLYNDSGHCWAYTSSNMLQYWQTYYGVFASKVGENKDALVHGFNYDRTYLIELGGTQSLKLNKLFYDSFTGTIGGGTNKAFGWYLQGENEWGGQLAANSAPGYFKQYFAHYNDTHKTINGQNIDSLEAMSDSIKQAFGYTQQNGQWVQTTKGQIMHLELKSGSSSHAITCYGFETDASGNIKALYVVNSDDAKYELVKVYTKFASYGYYDYRLELHYDEACSGYNSYNAWAVTGWSSVNTPEVLRNMLAEYESGELVWMGSDGGWSHNATTDAIATNGSGWKAYAGTGTQHAGYYHSYYAENRALLFDDTASSGEVVMKEDMAPASMTVNNNTLTYDFIGGGFTLTTSSLTKSGTAAAAFSDINLSVTTTTVNGGSMELVSGAQLNGTSAHVSGGRLDLLLGGNATLTSTLTLDKDGGMEVAADSTLTAENVSVRADGTLSFTGGTATVSGALSVASGGTLVFSEGTAITATQLSAAEGSTIRLEQGDGELTASSLELTGTMSLGRAELLIDFADTQISYGVTYTISSATGGLTRDSAADFYVIGGGYESSEYTAILNSSADGNSLLLTFTSGDGSVEWGNGSWDNPAGDNSVPSLTENNTLLLNGGGSSEVSIPDNAALNKLQVNSDSQDYRLTGNELKVGGVHITEGKLTIANKLTDVAGDVSVESTGSLNVTAGGKLEADRLKLETGSSFSNAGSTVISGKLDAEKLSIDNTGSLSIGAGSKLGTMTGGGELHVSGNNVTATDIGTLSALHLAQGTRFTVSQQTTVNKEFSNAGLLVCHDTLTFKQNVDSGGDVTARQLVLQGSRNTFEQVKTDALTLQGLSGTDQPLLAVDSLLSTQARSRAAGSPTIITLLNPDAAWDTYSLITAAHGLEAEAFTLSPETLEAYRNARTEATLHSDGNTLYLTLEEIILDRYERAAGTANGVAAARQMDALRNAYIVEATTHPDLAALMSALDAACELGENSRVEQTATAAAGASIPAMSVALAGDVSRRLRDIRNRMPSMGVDSRYEHPDMPYVNAWLNAEGGYSELESDGTASGYSLSQWGGTVGVDVDATENLTLGVACTALYGDFQADGVDMAEGDMDTCYASLFARWNSSRWVHSFVMTGGVADVTLDRTVNYGNGSYSTSGETDGSSFGLLYELAYTIRGAEDESVCWQPLINISYVHTALDAYTEKGSDAALSVGEQEFDRLSIAAGVRMQAIVAENLYERHAVLELRALAKADIGDREGEVNTAFTALPGSTATLRSNDYGAVGLELGAGLIVPVGAYSGELFFDVSADLRSGYNDVNGAMGWRVHF